MIPIERGNRSILKDLLLKSTENHIRKEIMSKLSITLFTKKNGLYARKTAITPMRISNGFCVPLNIPK